MVKQLDLYLDEDDLIRCKGRLQFSCLPKNSAFPILLPYNSHFTKLVIMDIHLKNLHFGVSYVLAVLRENYWVPKGRLMIKSVLRKCVSCNKVQAKPFATQLHAPLPKERITESRPFQVTGLDYSGALYVRDYANAV